MKNSRLQGIAILLLLISAGCKVGPNYATPEIPVPPAFVNGAQTNLTTTSADAQWWRGFEDAKLVGLIDRALARNHDLRIASANFLQARELRLQSRLDLLPTVLATGSYANTVNSRAALSGATGIPRELTLYDAGFDATWELDFFGRVRRSVEASTAVEGAAVAALHDVQVSLVSEVARNYFELRGGQNQLAVARRNADNQRQTLQITVSLRDGGRGTELDVARARAQMNNTLARIPPLEAAVAHAIHRLGVLTGGQPSDLADELSVAGPLPKLPPLVAIGNPEELLRRRPDIRLAERNVAAASARVGVAVADLFPRVTFNGRVGLEASTISGLGGPASDTRSFGPQITWAALDLGRVRAGIRANEAQLAAQVAQYEKTVLISLEETENALVDFGREQTRREFLRESVKAGESAAQLAHERFDNGATDFITVLDAERVLLDAQDQLAQSETRTATTLVAVYKSLGGGWEYAGSSPASSAGR